MADSIWDSDPVLHAEADAERQRHRVANGGADNWHESDPLKPVNPATLDGAPVPPRRWLVPDWVPIGRVTALYGAGGEGKTILGQMLATACAVGALWFGQSVLRCNSLLLFCEDDLDEMHRRQDDINQHFGCTFADLAPMCWLPRLGSDNALMTFDRRPRHTPLFAELSGTAKEHDARLIIVDTLADVFPGNENDRGQARAFAQVALGLLARETQGAVLVLAHPSRAGMNSGSGESGSTAWVGTFRSQLYLETPKPDEGEVSDPAIRSLTRRKSNAARRDEMIKLRWRMAYLLRSISLPASSARSSVVPPSGYSSTCWTRRRTNDSRCRRTTERGTTHRACLQPDRIESGSPKRISSAPCRCFSPAAKSSTRTMGARATCVTASRGLNNGRAAVRGGCLQAIGFAGAVVRGGGSAVVCDGCEKVNDSMCGGVRRMGWSAPPYPYALRGAILARAAGAWSRKG